MEFRMLGPFEAWHDGQQVDLGDLQQRYVLVVLLRHLNRPVSPQRLIEIVWGADRPRSNLVPGYVAKLRKAFTTVGATDAVIEKTTTGYVLRAAEDQLDTARFAALCERARETDDRRRAAELLHEAVGLWRGDFLEDLDIDRVGGSDVISPDHARIDALGDLAELELSAGNHRWVRDRLRQVVHDDPSRHRHALLLMRALLANGDQVEAMRVYHRTRDALDEAGLHTPVELRREAWAAQHGAPNSTLPARPGRFTGRASELEAIESAADLVAGRDEPGVLWVSGMPGVGKTALAVEAAHRLAPRFPDARLFVALDGFTPNLDPIAPTEALAKLLGDLGVPDERIPPTLTGRSAHYQAMLAGTRTVVVLDNAASEEQVRPLLPQAPGCLAIVTSRKIGDLDTGENVHVEPFSPGDATRLFQNLVGPDRVRGKSAEVTEVVTRCGRLPLQIKVAASQFRRHRRWPLSHLVRLLDEAGPWTAGADRREAAGAIACMVSYRQLDEPRRAMFRLFGANPGHDLSVPAAAAFAGDTVPRARQLLDDLHEVSLLEEAAPERYHILDPLKQFAESIPADERGPAIDRLLDFYLVNTASAIETAFPFDQGQPAVDRDTPVAAAFGDQKAAFEWLSAERPNLVAAIRYAAGHGRPVHTWQLAVLLWRYFNATNHIDEWIDALELARQTVMADHHNQLGQAHVLLRLASAHRRSGQLTHALELAAQALPRWVRLGDLRGEADTLCAIAKPTMELGEHRQAIAHLEAALTKYEQVGELRGQGNALSMLGLLNEQRGNLELAERQHVAAVAMLRRIGDRQGLAHGLDNLGSVRQRLGAVDEALAHHQEAHGLALETGDRGVAAYALNNMGNVYRLRGDLDEAQRYQEEARQAADGLEDAYLRTELYLDRGATLHVRDDQTQALRNYRAALDLATGTGDRAHQAKAHRGIAQALHTTGDHSRAATHWNTAESTFVQLRQPEAGDIRRERQLLRCACTPP